MDVASGCISVKQGEWSTLPTAPSRADPIPVSLSFTDDQQLFLL